MSDRAAVTFGQVSGLRGQAHSEAVRRDAGHQRCPQPTGTPAAIYLLGHHLDGTFPDRKVAADRRQRGTFGGTAS